MRGSRCIRGCLCCAASPFSRRFKDEVRVMQHPPFSHYVLGRTPAAGRRNPRRGFVIKRFLGTCGSRSWRGWFWAARSKPKREIEQRNSHPLGGASSRRGGPAERSEKGARCTTRTLSYATASGGALQNTNALSCNCSRGRDHKPCPLIGEWSMLCVMTEETTSIAKRATADAPHQRPDL